MNMNEIRKILLSEKAILELERIKRIQKIEKIRKKIKKQSKISIIYWKKKCDVKKT